MTAPIVAIIKKDLKLFLTGPTFYFLSGFYCCVLGLVFYLYLLYFNDSPLSHKSEGLDLHRDLLVGYVWWVLYILVFFIAVLSLRFFTEEKKTKTFSVLLTSPITSWQIVLAKWLLGILFLLIFLLLSFIYPLSLCFFLKVPFRLLLLDYLGIFLSLCVFMSIGLVVSISTRASISCIIMTEIFILLFVWLGSLLMWMFGGMWFLLDFFRHLYFAKHVYPFLIGIFNLSSVFYFLSWSVLLFFITERLVESHRWQ